MTARLARLAFCAALALAAGAEAAPAPKVRIVSFTQLETPLPYPYDETANADAQVAAAKARAKARGKLLLIDLGGNWCADCRILAGALELPELKRFVQAHYEVVAVDVGRIDRNLGVATRYGIDRQAIEGVPSLLVVDPRTDALLDRGHISALADARSMTPQALADWLAKWTPN